jgi:hypothetical protein
MTGTRTSNVVREKMGLGPKKADAYPSISSTEPWCIILRMETERCAHSIARVVRERWR